MTNKDRVVDMFKIGYRQPVMAGVNESSLKGGPKAVGARRNKWKVTRFGKFKEKSVLRF